MDARGFARLSDWTSLPTLGDPKRYVQQTSREHRSTPEIRTGLSRDGNRDYNNFLCASADADVSRVQIEPFRFLHERCEESYARGVMLARFVGPGRHVRSWLGMASLLSSAADAEILRVYVDDDPQPRIELPLALAIAPDPRDEIFAPPFGAGSPRRLSWYYPVTYAHKLIITLDHLGDNDAYYYHCDVVTGEAPLAADGGQDRDRAAAVSRLEHLAQPAGELDALWATRDLPLAAGATQEIALSGPGTLHELRVRFADVDYPKLAAIRLRIRWESSSEPAIDLSLRDLFGTGEVPPEGTSSGLTSRLESGTRTLGFKLPMPFVTAAAITLTNESATDWQLELGLWGKRALPAARFGHLHAQRHETLGPTDASEHNVARAAGLGRLVGVCGYAQGHADPDLFLFGPDQLNLLEGDVSATIDGQVALDGTGTEEYSDDVFYFRDAPRANAFVQAWGVINEPSRPPGRASFCRWHVLGTELDFADALTLDIELGGSGNPGVVERLRTVAFLYQ